jgi:ribosomal small subunit protein bTHX
MGKGDKKTYKGKLFRKSYGKKRPRKVKKSIQISKKPLNANTQKGKLAEEFVNELSYIAYLKYWCYPNPIDLAGNKNEICDLLILFFDTAIIISVKNYEVNGNYKRYKAKVIDKSTKQLFGAERKLFQSQRRIVIQHPEKEPEVFNPSQYENIFRITVSVGEDFEKSVFIDSKENKGYVNIFNKETFSIITQELDTIKDLVNYLIKRELLFKENMDKNLNCTEKDLLGSFLMNNREFNKSLFDNFENETTKLVNNWAQYISNKSVIRKKLADEKSYFIDELIENDVLKLDNGEMLAAELMTMSRFERRVVANNLFEIVEKYQSKSGMLGRRFANYNGVGFLFIYYPIEAMQNEIDGILHHAQMLYSYFHKTEKIVLLASTENLKQWKFGLYVANRLSKRQELMLQNLAKRYEWFQNEQRIENIIEEYPEE